MKKIFCEVRISGICFGAFPPRDLIAAQKNAKKALAAYIEAANLTVANSRGDT